MWLGIGIVIALCCLVWTVSYLSYLPRYNVETITVAGASHVAPSAVTAFVDSTIHPLSHPFFSPSNIFLYHPAALAAAISTRFPWILSTKISRDSLLSTHVSIALVERSSFALWCQSPSASSTPCYEMDTSGLIFAPIDAQGNITRATSYIFTGGLPTQADLASPIGDVFAAQHFADVLSLLQYLALDGLSPTGANILNDTDYTVPLSGGYYLKISFGQHAEVVAKNLQLILSSDALKNTRNQLLYVDLRFGDRVYYKLKGTPLTGNQSNTVQ